MKVLIECATRNYQVYYKLCQVLHQKYPEAEFGYFSTLAKTNTIFEDSEDPEFNIYDPFNQANFISDYESNMTLIREFESYSGITIWKMIAADREIGWNDHVGNYGTYVEEKFRRDREYLMATVASEIRGISQMFNDFKPDILIPAQCMGSVAVLILEGMCKKSGVHYLLPTSSRISNLHRITENSMCLSSVIDRDYHLLIKNNEIDSCSKGKKLHDDIKEDFSNLGNFDADYLETYGLFEINNKMDSLRLFSEYLLDLLTDVKFLLGRCLKIVTGDILNLKNILYIYKLRIKLRSLGYANKKVVLNKSFGQLPSDKQKYLYFPLYNIPEYSSNFLSTMWLNILSVVEALSKSIPGDWIILLKEHPTGLEHNYRQKDFYDQLNRIPNVEFAPVLANGNSLIANAELVFVTVGTSGWEAILKGIPVLSPVECFWDCMGLSYRSSDIETLHEDIRRAVDFNNKITATERERRVVAFLQALVDNSFPISDPEVFSYYYEGTQDQYYEQGQELAEGFIQYFEKTEINKRTD
jgi:hypothetical protein